MYPVDMLWIPIRVEPTNGPLLVQDRRLVPHILMLRYSDTLFNGTHIS